jgi:thioredoxin-related protein
MNPIRPALIALAAVTAVSCLTMAGGSSWPSIPLAAPGSSAPATAAKSGTAVWLTDFAAAQQEARAGRKFTLLDFTGSDWCPWCMKLDREILTTPEFREFADKHLVLVKVDFPMHHPQSAAEQAQNEQLATQFQVQGYPTLVVLNPDGRELGTLGYEPGGPKTLITELAGMMAD